MTNRELFTSLNVFTRRKLLTTSLACALLGPTSAISSAQGRFVGTVVTEWAGDGRRMRLLQPFEFIDSNGRRWPVPASTVVDGASIPQFFWSFIGGPFEGLYRNPSVIHDYFCDARTRPHDLVHRTFHDSMLVAGVSRSLALLMYKAVAVFGPKWPDPKIDPRCEIFHEDYDFELCVRNTAKPDIYYPPIDRDHLNDFANELEGMIESQDLAMLRRKIEASN